MRVVGVDIGLRRIGIARSDATCVLASPWKALVASGNPAADAERVAAALATIEEGVQAVVVGHPRRLDGSATDLTVHVEAFVSALRDRIQVPVALQDERLTSHEADQRLALREKDWRKRKAKLDIAAAAILLQDYLDSIR